MYMYLIKILQENDNGGKNLLTFYMKKTFLQQLLISMYL